MIDVCPKQNIKTLCQWSDLIRPNMIPASPFSRIRLDHFFIFVCLGGGKRAAPPYFPPLAKRLFLDEVFPTKKKESKYTSIFWELLRFFVKSFLKISR